MLCNDFVIIEHGRKIAGSPSAPQDTEYDNNSIEY